MNTIFLGDCAEGMKQLQDNSVSSCVTDPPYNYEFIGMNWDGEEIIRRKKNAEANGSTLVKNIPYGSGLAGGVRNKRWYERNRENILNYSKWCKTWGEELFRVVKPGAYVCVFNSTRTIAHVQTVLEEIGFYARDIIVWRRHSGIPKGLNFEKKLDKIGKEGGEKWNGWHSALRGEWEAICLVQKPLINNYMETIAAYDVGLMNTILPDGSFHSNIIEDIKRDKVEDFNSHCTVKPLELIYKLVSLVTPKGEGHLVIDPFMGSGTTALAALMNNNSFVGFEKLKENHDICLKRINGFDRKNYAQMPSIFGFEKTINNYTQV